MHGLILAELQRYVETHVGSQAWNTVCRRAQTNTTAYTHSGEYPEGDLGALVIAGSEILNVPINALLEDFGAFMVPDLMTVCSNHLKPEWRALDLLEHPERHRLLAERLTGRSITPPVIRTERLSEREVRLVYGSDRRMCALTRGIIRGIFSHFREVGAVRESACMHKGAPHCVIYATRLGN